MDVQKLSLMRPEHRGCGSTSDGLPKGAARSPKNGGLRAYETLAEWGARDALTQARAALKATKEAEAKAKAAVPETPTDEDVAAHTKLSEALKDADKAVSEAKAKARAAGCYDETDEADKTDEQAEMLDAIDTMTRAANTFRVDLELTVYSKHQKALLALGEAEESTRAARRVVVRCELEAQKARASHKLRLQKLGVAQ
jgi:hypothetical protein